MAAELAHTFRMTTRNSRWDNDPILDKDGKPDVAVIGERDLAIFRLLNRYRYLRSNFIPEFTGGSYIPTIRRLDQLQRVPNKYLSRPEKQRAQPNANYRHLIYELAARGEHTLKDRGLYSEEKRFGDEILFAHSMMVNDTIASLELATRDMIWWPEIAGRLQNPQRFIPVEISHQFKTGLQTLEFDYQNDSNGPFGIRYPDGRARFFSLEAEHTNQVDCNNLRKTSFLKKFLAIQQIMEKRLYQSVWGVPNLLTLVVAPFQARIDTMKDLILRETGGKGASYILFRVVPVLEDPFSTAKPMPDLFHGPWQRAGHPDLFLNQPTEKAR
jgi:hypothetical protein